MTLSKYGSEFPPGSLVYFMSANGRCEIIFGPRVIQPYTSNYIFYFEDDGLWATECVRHNWKINAHRHPHCTLFRMLYKKLQNT